MTDCAHCVWGQRAEGRGHDARTSCCQVNANAPPRGGTRRRLWRGNSTCGQVCRQSESRTQFAYLHIILALAENQWGAEGQKGAQSCHRVPLDSLDLCAQRKLQCVFNLWLRIGHETETQKLWNPETEAEARTETVISCDAWPKPQLSPLPPLPIRSIHGNLAHETRHLSLISPECSALSPEIWGVHVMEPLSLN